MQRWLADVRRMPRVTEIALQPLDKITTADHIADLLGGPPHRSLVEDVFARSRGNPYLNRLLIADLDAGARHVSPLLASDLRSAVLQTWFRLPDATRHLSEILAVAGTPLTARELSTVIGGDSDAEALAALLHGAASAGVLDLHDDGFWFHHPLSAEVLAAELDESERNRWHKAIAVFLEHRHLVVSAQDAAAIADHRYDAGDDEAGAYEWSLRAVSLAESIGSDAAVRLLARAIRLLPRIPGAAESRRELLQRARGVAEAAGAQEEELRAVEALLDGIAARDEPLVMAELLVRRMKLRFLTGREFLNKTDIVRAVELSSADPASWQYALALAELAHTELWQGHPDGSLHAEQALVIAQGSGNAQALSFALTADAIASLLAGDADRALRDAGEAVEAAVIARDWLAFIHATQWEGFARGNWTSEMFAMSVRRRREELSGLGAPHVYVADLSSTEAWSLLPVGEWRQVMERLRVTLGSDPGLVADVGARLTAARLATWQGRQGEAAAHLVRADELSIDSDDFINFEFDAVRAEVCLGAGRAAEAFDAAMAGASIGGTTPTMCEWLVPLAARALADLAQTARDERSDDRPIMARLDDLVERFPRVIQGMRHLTPLSTAQVAGLQALCDAEVLRARADERAGAAFAHPAHAFSAAELAWEEAYAVWRAAELLLTTGHNAGRGRAIELLRRGVVLAEQLQATDSRRSKRGQTGTRGSAAAERTG